MVKPFNDILRFLEKPILTIEVSLSNQGIQEMLQKSKKPVVEGVKTVWTVKSYGHTVFIAATEQKAVKGVLFHEEVVRSEGIRVDFSRFLLSLPKIQGA